MHRVIVPWLALLSVFVLVAAEPFTPGNIMIVYGSGTADVSSSALVSTYIKELTLTGTTVQTLDISSNCQTSTNPYTSAPRLSTDGQSVVVVCYIDAESVWTAATISPDSTVYTSTKNNYPANQIMYRALRDGNDVYFAGDYLIGYTTFGESSLSPTSLVSTVFQLQDVYITPDRYLIATNYASNPWGAAVVGSSTVPINTDQQPATTFFASDLVDNIMTVSIFDKDNKRYAYVTQRSPSKLHFMSYTSDSWSIAYSTSDDLGKENLNSHIYYDNGDGTTTILLTSDSKIYKTVDSGSDFSALTSIYTATGVTIKGLSWVPQDPVPPSAPVAPPVAAPMTDAPTVSVPSTAPTASVPTITPAAGAPVSAPSAKAPGAKISNANEPNNICYLIMVLAATVVVV